MRGNWDSCARVKRENHLQDMLVCPERGFHVDEALFVNFVGKIMFAETNGYSTLRRWHFTSFLATVWRIWLGSWQI